MNHVNLHAYMYVFAVFVEKILRVQPDVKKIYLLLRASDTETAKQRLHNEVRINQYCIHVIHEIFE